MLSHSNKINGVWRDAETGFHCDRHVVFVRMEVFLLSRVSLVVLLRQVCPTFDVGRIAHLHKQV